MDLPSFTIDPTTTFSELLGDVVDSELEAEVMANAAVIFTPNIGANDFVVWDQQFYRVKPVPAYINDDGQIEREYESGGHGPVFLLANNPDLNVTNVQWTIAIKIGKTVLRAWTFNAGNDGETLNLATVAPVANVPAKDIERGPRGYTPWFVAVPDTTPQKYQAMSPEGPVGEPDVLDVFDGGGDVFNWKASNTRKLQRSLAKALAGTGASDHLVVGDSTSALYIGGGVNFPAMWPRKLWQLLNSRGVPGGGTGWVLTGNDPSMSRDPRYTSVGTWTDVATCGYLSTTTAGNSLTFTSDVPGTAVSVAFHNTSQNFSVSIDGGAAVPVYPAGTATLGFYTVTGLADTTHVVTINVTSNNPNTTIMGVNVYRTTGLRIHNASISGAVAQGWASWGHPTRPWITKNLGITPDVLHIPLGVNDLRAARTVPQVIADLTAIRNYWSAADVILYAEYEPGGLSSGNSWAHFVDELYELAVSLDCPLIDLYHRSGGLTAATANGWMGDTIHPNVVAQADWATVVANAIMKAA